MARERIKHHQRMRGSGRGRPPKALTIKDRTARKLRTKAGRERHAQWELIVEPVFGFVKRGSGFVHFLAVWPAI